MKPKIYKSMRTRRLFGFEYRSYEKLFIIHLWWIGIQFINTNLDEDL